MQAKHSTLPNGDAESELMAVIKSDKNITKIGDYVENHIAQCAMPPVSQHALRID
jgi:hypothetical protein